MIAVVTAQDADKLNKKVQQLIDPRLFVCCNFEPTPCLAVSEDGKYLIGIQDLYKFFIDSSCIVKNYYRLIPPTFKSRFFEIEKRLHEIEMLRAVTDHNQSDENGWLERERLDAHQKWMLTVLGKPAAETVEDFAVLNRQLEVIAKSLLAQVDSWIVFVSQQPDRAAIVDKWIETTLYWYSHNTKVDFYKGQLIDVYMANAGRRGVINTSRYTRMQIYGSINRWIRAALFHDIDADIEEKRENLRKAERVWNQVTKPDETQRAVLAALDAAKRQALESRLQACVDACKAEWDRTIDEKEMLERRIWGKNSGAVKKDSQCTQYFLGQLQTYLRETMARMESAQMAYTLLPQDLMQQDIAFRFDGVASPDGHF